MAETTTESTTTVKGAISKFFKGTCDETTTGKYKAAIHIFDCDQLDKCGTTIACGLEINTPEFILESIRVEDSESCDIFSASDELSWADYSLQNTAEMGEWSQDLYYNPARLDIMQEWFESRKAKVVVIDVADGRRTQFAFKAYLTQWNAAFTASSDTEVAMLPATFQPTGAPYFGYGETLKIC